MSSKTTVFALLCAASAHAQTAAQVCAQLAYADSKVACVRTITGHQVAPEAAAVCGSIPYADQVVRCLAGALDKTYEPGALEACSSIPYADQKAECVAAAGSVPRARTDEDDDDRRARRRREPTGTFTIENRSARIVFERIYWRGKSGGWTEFPGKRPLRGGIERSLEMFLGRYDFCAQATDGRSVLWRRIEISEGDVHVTAGARDLDDVECLDR